MMNKTVFILLLLISSAYVTAAELKISRTSDVKVSTAARAGIAQVESLKKKVFTLEQLKKFDGKEGRPAFAAVDGIVYDLSKAKPWHGGRHMGLHNAGQDLSEAFKKAPPFHSKKHVLSRYPVVGELEVMPAADPKISKERGKNEK